MSDGLNRWCGLGNLAADPELRVTPVGQSVLHLRLACNESYLDRNNVRQEKVEFVRATVWGKRADALAKILSKGDKLYLEGSLHTSSYEKNGEKRYSTEVNAKGVYLCGGGKRGDHSANDADAPRRRETSPQTFGSSPVGELPPDDGIPF